MSRGRVERQIGLVKAGTGRKFFSEKNLKVRCMEAGMNVSRAGSETFGGRVGGGAGYGGRIPGSRG